MQLDEPFRWQLLNDLRSDELAAAFDTWANKLLDPANEFALGKYKTTGSVITVDHFSQNLVEQLETLGVPPATTAVTIRDKEWFHLQHKDQSGFGAKRKLENLLTQEQAKQLPQLMRGSKAVMWDNQDKMLLYVFDVVTDGKQGKVAITVNYKLKDMIDNAIRSASLLNIDDIQAGGRYKLLEGIL